MDKQNKVFELWSFHQTLRKWLSSDASSICWNAIHMMAQEHINTFCTIVRERSGENFATRCKKAVPHGYVPCNLLRIGLGMLEPEEWIVLEENSFVATDDEDRVA